jgi:hypothetical protein
MKQARHGQARQRLGRRPSTRSMQSWWTQRTRCLAAEAPQLQVSEKEASHNDKSRTARPRALAPTSELRRMGGMQPLGHAPLALGRLVSHLAADPTSPSKRVSAAMHSSKFRVIFLPAAASTSFVAIFGKLSAFLTSAALQSSR